jgi:hypothetical protein
MLGLLDIVAPLSENLLTLIKLYFGGIGNPFSNWLVSYFIG